MKVFAFAVLLASFSAAFGFMPSPVKPMTARSVVSMSAAKEADFGKQAKAVLAGLTAPIIASAPVWATEGTGEAFGIDDSRIVPIVAVLGIAFATLFSTWSNSQTNDEFFDTYNRERK